MGDYLGNWAYVALKSQCCEQPFGGLELGFKSLKLVVVGHCLVSFELELWILEVCCCGPLLGGLWTFEACELYPLKLVDLWVWSFETCELVFAVFWDCTFEACGLMGLILWSLRTCSCLWWSLTLSTCRALDYLWWTQVLSLDSSMENMVRINVCNGPKRWIWAHS